MPTANRLALQPVALLVLILVPETAGVIAFVLLFGAAKGCMTLVRPAFVADLYGPAHYASIAGVLAFKVTIAQAAAPLGAGAAYDALGRYDPVLWVLVLVSALASMCLLPARPAHEGLWLTSRAHSLEQTRVPLQGGAMGRERSQARADPGLDAD